MPELRHDLSTHVMHFLDYPFPALERVLAPELRNIWVAGRDWRIDGRALGNDEAAFGLSPAAVIRRNIRARHPAR